ncbi:MAG: FecR domain-containing protein [Leptospiraceae bacterium]|nr:FecR domain-containing protein [Leptospiraceae bacterium]
MKKYILLIFLLACSPKEEVFHPKALVITAIGEVTSNGKKVQLAQEITDSDVISVGKNSLCDLQLLDSDTLIVVRIKPNSKFQLTGKKIGSKRENFFSIFFGNAIFNATKVSEKDGIQTLTPTLTAGVRGTKYEVNVSSNGSTKILVLEGQIQAKLRIPELEDSAKSDSKKNKALKLVSKTIEKKELDIKQGELTEIDSQVKNKILSEMGLSSKSEKNTESKIDLDKLEERLLEVENYDMKATTQQVDPKLLTQKLKEYEEIVPFEKEKINNKEKRLTLIQARHKTIEDSWFKRFKEWLRSLKF